MGSSSQTVMSSCYPASELDTERMNRQLRHRLRNFVTGMQMGLGRVAKQAESDATITQKCDVMQSELSGLQKLTERMDLLFSDLPSAQPEKVDNIIQQSAETFAQTFPLCSLDVNAHRDDSELPPGNWMQTALQELLVNAGEACSTEGVVHLEVTVQGGVQFHVYNRGQPFPAEIPTNPPKPFYTTKSRHDGLGLPIAYRCCMQSGGSLAVHQTQNENPLVCTSIHCNEAEPK